MKKTSENKIKKVYIVERSAGEYEDYRTFPEKCFLDKNKANEFKDKMNESVKQFDNMRDDFMKIQDLLDAKTTKKEENMSDDEFEKFHEGKKYWRNNVNIFIKEAKQLFKDKYTDKNIKDMYNFYNEEYGYTDIPYFYLIKSTIEL